ncbi:MAG: (Na+)-NQR maturation NqrM [Methylophagaceae bacterium]
MSIFIATFIILTLAVIGMAIGVIMGRPAIKGSCGGLNQVGLSGSCGGACSTEEKEICAKEKAAKLNQER